MLCTCPKCGRQNDVSTAELQLQEGNVVCPRCLTVFQVDLPESLQHSSTESTTPPPVPQSAIAEPASTQPQQSTSIQQSMPTPPPVQYCRHCGTRIPANKTACPNCHAPVSTTKDTTTPQQQRRTIEFVQKQPASPSKPRRASTSKKKNKKASSSNYWSSETRVWGCMGSSVLIVVVFFALYYLIGNLF